jgi:hypothetical protein
MAEPVFTSRLQLGLGLLCGGLGLLFLAAKVLPAPIPSAIAGGIAVAVGGFAVVIVEGLREPPLAGPPGAPADPPAGPPRPPERP